VLFLKVKLRHCVQKKSPDWRLETFTMWVWKTSAADIMAKYKQNDSRITRNDEWGK